MKIKPLQPCILALFFLLSFELFSTNLNELRAQYMIALHNDEKVEDVEIDIETIGEDLDKLISISSNGETNDKHKFIIETSNEKNEEGKTMIFVKKSSKSKVTSDLPTKLSESFDQRLSISNLNLYPNPTNGNFNINFKSEEEADYEIQILDPKGTKIFKKEIKGFKGEYNEEFDFSKYSSGTYYFKLFSNDKKVTKKVVVQ